MYCQMCAEFGEVRGFGGWKLLLPARPKLPRASIQGCDNAPASIKIVILTVSDRNDAKSSHSRSRGISVSRGVNNPMQPSQTRMGVSPNPFKCSPNYASDYNKGPFISFPILGTVI